LTRERLSLLETKSGEGGWIDKRTAFFVWRRRVARELTGFAAKPKQGRVSAECGIKGRQIQRPFHSDYVLLRSLNQGEMDELQSSLPLLYRGIRGASPSISSLHPPSSPTVLMHLTSQATVDLYHAAFVSPSSVALTAPPRATVSSFSG
jgi:hypothetical protein